MTVYTRYGNAVKDPAAILAVNSIHAEAQARDAYSKISVASDGIGSVHLLARLPSNARLKPGSTVYFSALTGLTDYDVGIGRDGVILAGKQDYLVNGEDIHTAGNVLMLKNVAVGSLGKLLWEHAGYTSDPGGMLDIIGTVNAAASTTGTIEAFSYFSKP